MKHKAKAYLQAAKDAGPLVMENAALKKEVQTLEETVSSMGEKLEIMSQRVSAMQSQPLVEVDGITKDDINIDWTKEEIPSSSPVDAKYSFETEKTIVLQEKSLEEQYIEKFGKKPHHKMKEETIRERLAG